MLNFKSWLSTFFGFLLILVLLLTSVDIFSFDRGFYQDQYEKLDVALNIGVSEQDITKATDVLLDYLQGKRDDMDVIVTIDGELEPMFNQREIDHMVDVVVLYDNAMLVRNLSLILSLAILLMLGVMYRKKALRLLARGIQNASVVFGVILAFLATYALVDFYGFWTQFHHVFFTNDLWLLDPNTDNLILMVPGEFFFALVFRIVGGFVAALIVVNVLAFIVQRKKESV